MTTKAGLQVKQDGGSPKHADMRIFVALERARTLTALAASLQLPLFTVSRAIKRMEQLAGVMLVKRAGGGLKLTETGRDYLQACREVLDAQAKANAVLHAHRTEPAGTLRIGSPVTFARIVLSAVLPEFQSRYPKLSLAIDLYSSEWDQESTALHDVFFKVRTPQQSRHHLKTFPAIRQGLFASPAYLEAHGTPVHPADLDHHKCVGHSEDGTFPPWNLTRGGEHIPVQPRLAIMVDDPEIQAKFALASCGVALLPLWLAENHRGERQLVPVLENWIPDPIVFCALYAGRLRAASKENALLHYLGGILGTASDPRCNGKESRTFFL